MSKQLWYANSTGGSPYTYGEKIHKKACFNCRGLGREYNGTMQISLHYTRTIKGLPANGVQCYNCKGKGFTMEVIGNEQLD